MEEQMQNDQMFWLTHQKLENSSFKNYSFMDKSIYLQAFTLFLFQSSWRSCRSQSLSGKPLQV